MKISNLARTAISTIIPYEPGKPISEVKREYGLSNVIKLASNENPLGPSPKAIEAVQKAITGVHHYPDGGGYTLKQKLSNKLSVTPEMIVLGNGSAETVELITEAFISEHDEAIIGKHAFFKYRIAVKIMNGQIAWAEMPNLQQDPEAIVSQITDRTKIIFIANPNNPTGTLMTHDQAEWMMDKIPDNVIVVFDEAYYDYRNSDVYPNSLNYIRDGRNVIALRTFSKSYGLAGLRMGYALTTPPIARAMNTVREAFNVNSLAMEAGVGALDDDEFLKKSIELNIHGKEFYYHRCEHLGLEYVPTEANFVLIKVPILGRDLFKLMLKKGVVIRPVDGYGLPEYVRVSIGLPNENERFFFELETVLREQGLS